MDLETTQTNTTAKLPILKQDEYDMWRLRIEQYFQVQDYALWDVIDNGNSFKPTAQTTTNAEGTSTTLIPGPVTTKEKIQKKNDVKARSMLLMTLPNEHLLIFNQYKDAKTFAPSTESLDFIFDRLQKIVSQLAILGENISQEDLNLNFLRSLPSEWNTHVVVWRNKPDLDTMSFDDLYNNFKIVEQEVKRTTSSSSKDGVSTANTQDSLASTQVSTTSTQVSTANLSDATVYAFLASQPNGSQLVHEDLEQIHEDDLEEMDLKWQLVLLSMRTKSYMADDEVPTNMALMAFSDSKFNKFEFNLATYKRGLASVEEQLVFYKKNEVIFCDQLAVLKRDISYKDSEISMLKSKLEKLKQEKESNQLKIEKFDNASKSLDKLIGSQIPDKSKKGVGFVSYNVVPPPHTSLFSPPKLDLSNSGLEEFQQPEFEGYGPKTSKSVSKDTSNEVMESLDASLVEELVSDDKLEKKTVFLSVAKIEFVRPKQQEKPVRKPVKYAEMYRFNHVQANCNYHQRKRVVYGNNYTRVNYNYSAKKAHPSAHMNMAPRAVLMKTGLRPLKTAMPVNTAHPKTTVYSASPMSCFSKSVQSTVKRPYQTRTTITNKIFSQKDNTAKGKFYTVRPKIVNTARPNSAVVNAVRANQSHPQKEDQGYVNRGCSRHMTGNMSYLSDFKEFGGGYVTFGGGAKEEKLLMCDKKNSVLFTDTRCFVLSPDFKLADESQVLLKVPRKNNMYSVDIKNIVPKECLTCLVSKATLDESMLWHRRLSHVKFKTINKLVKENLVRGLPTKHFENDQTCVACLKGKQHKASCKSKIQNSITQPLFMLHMDLFGPTFVSSLMNKKYCLVVTDDYSRFTWVFFLATKDETSGILKSFITEIENLVDKKVKIIRCDNGTEFKNKVMSEFCEQKGIKREYSNRVLVVKPHNKTPYELFRGRTPALSFMRPFGCHVTILNTLDYLGKFDGKSDEGFFVGYSMNSKAFRVYNIRTRKVEENLHIRFLEDKPIIAGDGPKWLFDIDVLTKSMNYVPVVAGTNSNDFVGTEESIGPGHSSKETGSSQDYILMPLWKDEKLGS
ncbi:putative ribonuclease H-like domain-containing protein [Tanacetum coccineum]